jgi:hypothetical protein
LREHVDGRDKPGHDVEGGEVPRAPYLGTSRTTPSTATTR